MLKRIKFKLIYWLRFFLTTSYQKEKFFYAMQYYPSTKKPLTINEMIFKLKMNSPFSYYRYADKVLVRDHVMYIINTYGLKNLFLPTLLAKSKTPEGLNENLPNQDCFIKANHGSGMCFLYEVNKNFGQLSNFKLGELKKWLKIDYSIDTHEHCYKKIDRVLFCEKPLICNDGSYPDDIKVHCYCGRPAVIQIIRRTSGELERKTFDEYWNEQEWFQNEVLDIDLKYIPKKDIIDYSEILSQNFPYVRVDFYLVDGKLYFSELTFYPMSATLPLKSYEVDLMLGKKYTQYCQDSKKNIN